MLENSKKGNKELMEDLMVEMLQVQQIMAVQLIR